MGGKGKTADAADRLQLIVIRLAAIAEKCEDENIRYELRQSIEQLTHVIDGLGGQGEPR